MILSGRTGDHEKAGTSSPAATGHRTTMIRLVPRGVLDIGWNHLLSSLIQTFSPASNSEPPEIPGTLAALSVRSAFDLYLQHLNAEPGDEVIMVGDLHSGDVCHRGSPSAQGRSGPDSVFRT